MAVYSNVQIRQAIEQGHILCHPYNPAHVSYASLDVTLGYHYYRINHNTENVVYNPLEQQAVDQHFDGPFSALSHQDWCHLAGVKPVANIPLDHPVIAVKPRETILAHSHEFIGILAPGVGQISARTSWSRNSLAIAATGGWLAPGYVNRLALEITNHNDHETILLPVGERLAQVVFHETGDVDGSYGATTNNRPSDKYQQGSNLDNIIAIWSPDMLLPSNHLDSRALPIKIEGATYE